MEAETIPVPPVLASAIVRSIRAEKLSFVEIIKRTSDDDPLAIGFPKILRLGLSDKAVELARAPSPPMGEISAVAPPAPTLRMSLDVAPKNSPDKSSGTAASAAASGISKAPAVVAMKKKSALAYRPVKEEEQEVELAPRSREQRAVSFAPRGKKSRPPGRPQAEVEAEMEAEAEAEANAGSQEYVDEEEDDDGEVESEEMEEDLEERKPPKKARSKSVKRQPEYIEPGGLYVSQITLSFFPTY